MQVHTFLADSSADAIAQIREKLGPAAVVLNVRKVPGEGIARLWNTPRIEVLAHLPEKPAAEIPDDAIAQLRQEISQMKSRFDSNLDGTVESPRRMDRESIPPQTMPVEQAEESLYTIRGRVANVSRKENDFPRVGALQSAWQIKSVLEESGLLPVHAASVVDELKSLFGEQPPESLGKQVDLARGVLARRWKTSTKPETAAGVHVFVGAPGVGKTTGLCKWLAQTVFLEGAPAEVWRLDSRVANTAESLSIYSDILGVPVMRFAGTAEKRGFGEVPGKAVFIDLPGVNPADAPALREFSRLLEDLPHPQVHLVLNAAYDTRLLLGQVRAFGALPVTDLVFTHLDEETRWGKLWNFVLGTNFSVRFLSSGQNVPGDFSAATAERILANQFQRNR